MFRASASRRRATAGAATAAALVVALLAALAWSAAEAEGRAFLPPKNKIYAGVSDTGSQEDYSAFSRRVGRHVAIMQSFEVWGGRLGHSSRRWLRTATRGMLSISTAPCYACEGVISPRRIKLGFGDPYLLRLNRFLNEWGRPTYIRLLPEMNGYWNDYSAFEADGSSRGRDHTTKQFRKAWRRIVIITKGGKRKQINRRLRRFRLPPLMRRGKGKLPRPPRRLGRTRAAWMWVPQTHGSPQIHANRPQAYWPGRRFVDWVGADIYGKFPNFDGLDRFYRNRKGLPFVIGEWSPWDVDDPSFTNRLHEWVESHKRARMMVYYQGFGEGNPFMLSRYPESADALARQLKNRRYKAYAPGTRAARKKAKRDRSGGLGSRHR